MNPLVFHKYVSRDVCRHLALVRQDDEAGARMVTLTAIAESGLREIDQRTGPGDVTLGPAYGLFQIEPTTWFDLNDNWLRHRPARSYALTELLAKEPNVVTQLATNLWFGAGVCRLLYFRQSDPMPDMNDLSGLAHYWKQHYNTYKGKGTVEGFIEKTKTAFDLLRGEIA